MRPEPVKEPQERDETDESLRLEPERTDDELFFTLPTTAAS